MYDMRDMPIDYRSHNPYSVNVPSNCPVAILVSHKFGTGITIEHPYAYKCRDKDTKVCTVADPLAPSMYKAPNLSKLAFKYF